MAKGEITHIEFPADDVERAKRFYEAVAGWEFSQLDAFPGFHLFRNGERTGGGLGKRGVSVGKAVRLYITVDSLEDGLAAALANGGIQVEAPIEIGEGMGRYAVVLDPEGSEIGLWEAAPGS